MKIFDEPELTIVITNDAPLKLKKSDELFTKVDVYSYIVEREDGRQFYLMETSQCIKLNDRKNSFKTGELLLQMDGEGIEVDGDEYDLEDFKLSDLIEAKEILIPVVISASKKEVKKASFKTLFFGLWIDGEHYNLTDKVKLNIEKYE